MEGAPHELSAEDKQRIEEEEGEGNGEEIPRGGPRHRIHALAPWWNTMLRLG